jgi:hypothetical protein
VSTSTDRLRAIPSRPSPTDFAALNEFARRLGECAAAISDLPWERVDPLLEQLWGEAKSLVPWSAVRESAGAAWKSAKRLY